MPLDPEEISAAGLPHSWLGGYKARPTEELLKRVAWDYRQLVHECAKHAETVERLTRRTDELESAQEIESEKQKQMGASVTDVTQLKQLRERVRDQLRETLDSMVAIGEAPSADDGEVSEPVSTASDNGAPSDPPAPS